MATVIIGAGVGGLAAAIALAARGEQVTVLESQTGAGGKMLPVRLGEHRFDSGPTVMTMRWVFDELLGTVGHATGLSGKVAAASNPGPTLLDGWRNA